MTRTKDIAMQMQEEESFEQRMGIEDEDYFIAPIDINSIEPSPATSEQIANGIIQAVKEGRISPIAFAVKKKCVEEAFDLVFSDKEVKKMCMDEIERYGKQGAGYQGATVKITNNAKYDYSKDPTWVKLNESIKSVMDQIKAQEEKIKVATKNNASLVDEQTGEMIASVVPCPRSESIAVSFKKK